MYACRRGARFPEAGDAHGCEPPFIWVRRWNMGLTEKQPGLLTAEPSL